MITKSDKEGFKYMFTSADTGERNYFNSEDAEGKPEMKITEEEPIIKPSYNADMKEDNSNSEQTK